MQENITFDRESTFDEVEGRSMVGSSILNTSAYKIIKKDFLGVIDDRPEYMCEICISWNYKKSVSSLKIGRYDIVVFENCYKSKSDTPDERELWICHSCGKFLKKKKMPPKANNLIPS